MIRVGLGLAVIGGLGVVHAPAADAYFTFSDHRLVGGIHNRTYFLDSTVPSATYGTAITRARDVWNPTTTQFWFYEQSTSSGAAVTVHRNSTTSGTGLTGFCARTDWYYNLTRAT